MESRIVSHGERRTRDAESVEGVENGEGYPLPSRLGGLGSVVSSPVGSGAEPRR